MSEVTTVNQTNNQAHFDYDVSKIFVWSNRYDSGSLLNASGDVKSFSPGLVIARIAATNKIVPFDGTATNGSQIPIGILKTQVTDLADAAESDVNYCISGDVVEDKIILEAGTLDSVVTIDTENTRIVRDMIQSVGIKILPSEELTNFDNQ
jgi:hypothetical protein